MASPGFIWLVAILVAFAPALILAVVFAQFLVFAPVTELIPAACEVLSTKLEQS